MIDFLTSEFTIPLWQLPIFYIVARLSSDLITTMLRK